MTKTAILLGATGLTGGKLLELLIEDRSYSKVILISRNSVNKTHPKIEEHLIDVLQLEENDGLVKGDVLFCCVGTTNSKTKDREKYKAIDHGIPVSAARIAKKNGVKVFMVLSAIGASKSSRVFYNRIKGEMERDVLAAGIPKTYILRPSLIGGSRDEFRLGESVAKFFMETFWFAIPAKYRVISPQTIAQAMLELSRKDESSGVITSDRIEEIANND